jgi:ribosomal protein S18 acetylase RimI-like enzyme
MDSPAPDPAEGWTARPATPDDVPALHALTVAYDRAGVGRPTTSAAEVEIEVAGPGADTRSHLVIEDVAGDAVGWCSLHDRALGRVVAAVIVDPRLDGEPADRAAAALFGWAERRARELAAGRGQESTQLDTGAYADDVRQHRWLAAAGFTHVRTWWQMSRPVRPEEASTMPAPRPGVLVRQLVRGDAEPAEADLRAVHDVLETAFTDHFNYHEESFEDFLRRQREKPGHTWDHWWLAEVLDAEVRVPAGALVGTVAAGRPGCPDGSYVAYLGVTRIARGRGIARSLLHAVIADAAGRGRDRVELEVDADSPTGATALYESLGFQTEYVTQSWHRDLVLPG